jgi:hypothetical protein
VGKEEAMSALLRNTTYFLQGKSRNTSVVSVKTEMSDMPSGRFDKVA